MELVNPVRKICVVITARPSYARIKTALEAIKRHPNLELILIVAASGIISRYGDVSEIIEADGFQINAKAMTLVEGENPEAMAKTTGLSIIELSSLFALHKPDAVITIADRYETIATAIASCYLNIPLIHIQGGELTGNIDDKVRHSITKLADYHFVASEDARIRVIRMGEQSDSVINTGCPSIDLVKRVLTDLDKSLPLDITHYGGVGYPIDLEAAYLVVLQHPVTNEHIEAQSQIRETLNAVHASDLPAIWFWPNPDSGSDGTSKGIRRFREEVPENKVHFFKNIGPEMFLKILQQARCIVGNSSVAIREGSFLGIPAVNIGTRQSNRLRGSNVLDVDHSAQEILLGIREQVAKYGRLERETLYGDGESGERIAILCATQSLRTGKLSSY